MSVIHRQAVGGEAVMKDCNRCKAVGLAHMQVRLRQHVPWLRAT